MVTEGAGSPRAEYAQQLVTFAGGGVRWRRWTTDAPATAHYTVGRTLMRLDFSRILSVVVVTAGEPAPTAPEGGAGEGGAGGGGGDNVDWSENFTSSANLVLTCQPRTHVSTAVEELAHLGDAERLGGARNE
jgi:hypothetical protein